MNANGELLRGFCEEMQLEILNETIADGRITWQGRDSQSAIDYILSNAEARERIMNMSIDEEGGFNIGTDHNLLLVRYNYKVREAERSVRKRKKRWCLRNVDWEKYKEDMNAMTGVSVNEINVMNDNVVENIRRVAKKSIATSKGRAHQGKYSPWWNGEIKTERKERKRLNKVCREWQKRESDGERSQEEYIVAWQKYKDQKKKVKYMIANAKMEYERKKVEELRGKGEEGGKEWYEFLRGDKCANDRVSELIVNGSRVNKRDEIANFNWENISNMKGSNSNERDITLKLETKDLSSIDREIQRREIEELLKCLENGKAIGIRVENSIHRTVTGNSGQKERWQWSNKLTK